MLMQPWVQPPVITKSVVLLLCLSQRSLQTHTSFHHYIMTTTGIYSESDDLKQGRTHFTSSEKAEVDL